MLTKIADFAIARPKAVLLGAVLILLLCGGFGATVQSHLKSGGFVVPELESGQASTFIDEHFPGTNPNLVVLISSPSGATSAAARTTGQQVLDLLTHRSDVEAVQSYWTARPDLASALISKDRQSTLVLVSVKGDDSAAQVSAGKISAALADLSTEDVQIRTGGVLAALEETNVQAAKDLALAEAVAVPLSLIALVLVFGSLIAASLPIAIGLFSIAATLGILRLLTLVTDVSIFALNMTTALGLALAIDYSLFIVSRYREELARGLDTNAAVLRAIQTAGRTVLFSALTVMLSVAALIVFQQYFLKSFAYAGVAVIAFAAAAAIVVLPAALVLLGDRVNSLDLRAALLRRKPVPPTPEDSRWYHFAMAVMRRPAPLAAVAIGVLLLVGAPFLSAQYGYPDDQVLPTSAQSRQVGDALRTDFAANLGASTVITLPHYQGDVAAVGSYAARLSKVAGVPTVLSADGVYVGGNRLPVAAPPGLANGAGTLLSVATTVDPFSGEGKRQLATLRAVPAPGPTMFAGPAAMNDDAIDSMGSRLPWAALVIALSTLIVLFLFTGSVLIPVKALLLNLISLSATFGAMIWIFQYGHLSELLGFTATGTITAAMPILMFCLAFGMSMDYEVFLLSRIREVWLTEGAEHTRGHNTHAVALGISQTARIFTAAAALMAIIFIAMATSQVSFMQMFGIGLTLAVLVDATLIRGVLVPALMQMMGTANWWAPKPLAALHRRIGLEEGAPPRDLVSP